MNKKIVASLRAGGGKWGVKIYDVGEDICVCAIMEQLESSHVVYVSPPNFIEKICGRTFKNKVAIQVLRCERWCERQNLREKISNTIVREYV